MLASSSSWSTILFLSTTLFAVALSQRCGGTIDGGAGVIRSPSYPDGYPASDCVWIIDSGAETRIRIRFKDRDCSGDSLWIYDGNGTNGVPLLGEFCSTDPPALIDSSGRLITIKFMSLIGADNKQGFAISYESIDDALGSRVIWSERLSTTGLVRLNSVPADPTEMLNPDGTVQENIVTSFYFRAPSGNWTALATRYGQHELMWSGGLRKAIIKGSMGSNRSARIYYAFTSSSVMGVAVDWLTGNVYWTDAAYDWIIMHDAKGKRNVLIVDEDLDIPTGIAIHPSRGYIFWTDSGSRPKIERSNLAGKGRIELVSTEIVRPSGITIDYETGLVYWVDADPSSNRVEVCDLEGAHRIRLMYAPSPSDLGFFDLTISGNYVYVTATEAKRMIVVRKDNGEELFNLNLQYTPYSIVTYAPDVQPQEYSPCSSNPCTFLCVGGGPNGYTCLCGNGFLLKEDGRTCEKEGTIDPPQYFVASQSKLCRYPINFPDFAQPMAAYFNVSCFLEGRLHAVAIAVDLEDGIVFYSDLRLKGIGMATLRDGASVKVITGGVRAVQGLAVDWVTKHLYWTDHGRGTIEVSKYDGSYRTTLIKDNVIKPRSIAIDPERKFMFWTEFGPPTQIERASLDGTGRVVIMTAPIGLPFFFPTGLAIDTEEQRLYYADLSTRTINKADYFGNNKRRILTKNGALFFDVALYKDYILWTELGGNNGIYAANRHTGQVELQYHQRGEQVYGITTYADTRQKIMHHPCRYQNGGCDQLCLSSTSNRRGFVCVCTLGFYLADDGKSCISDLVQDNFFLVTDTYRRAIFQVDLQSTFEPKALYLPSIQNPIAVTFDPIDRKVYWTDVTSKSLSRASLDGSNHQVLARDGVEHPDGIAVDSISRLLYWTDYGTHTLSVSHLDGSMRKILIRDLDKPRALVLHPVEGTMFWTDWGVNPVIERAFMDGTERTVIVSGSLVWPNGLTIDYDGNRLYWCDAGLERLETADFDGRGRRLLHAFGSNVHTYDVAVLGQFLYWTDWALQSVLKVDKVTGRDSVTVGPNDYLRPNAIYMVSSDSLPSGDNSCSNSNGGCSGLCLPVGFDRSCTCADGFRFAEDGTTCVQDQVTECPRVFHNGLVDEPCDPRPGHICMVRCLEGFVPLTDAIICQASGTWDRDVITICTAQPCLQLETPPNALAGPCSPPYNTGKMCTHTCKAGYTATGGDTRRLCDRQGGWIGIPISCKIGEIRISNPSACNPELTFLEEPENSQRTEGDFVEPRCRVSDEDAPIAWFKDGQRLDPGVNGNGIIVDQYSGLLIPSFDSGHQGHYACVVLAGDTECLRAEANITLNPLGFFSIVPEDASIDSDLMNFHFFMCTPKDETWSIFWEKDDEPMENPTTRSGNLLLLDINEEDEGKYTCVVRNPRSRSEGRADAWLYLSDPPQIDISTTCGTITFWRDTIQPTPSPEVEATTEADVADDGSLSWSSFGIDQQTDGRVVGGNRAKSGSAPFMVRIMEFRDREWIHRCGASLLDQSWILTAAHCMFEEGTVIPILKSKMNLFFGDYDTLTREDSEKQRRPAEIIVHEEYNQTTFDNDIALIRIEPPLREFTSYIRPICLAPSGLSRRLMQSDSLGRVTGWGQHSFRGPLSRFLKDVEVPFVNRQTCRESVADDTSVLTDSMFCAGYHTAGQDACGGDSGGPLAVRNDDGRWYQLGIVSWGIGCAAKGEYGFYTRVSRFLDWVRSKEATVAYSPHVGRRFNESLSSDVLDFAMRSPSELTVAAGSKVDLECVPNRSDAFVAWFIGNSPNPVHSLMDGLRILPSGTVFHFDAIEEAFSGVYSCEARVNDEDGEQTIRATFRLALNHLSFFSIIPENASIDINDINFHFFMCTPKDETWSISWEKDDEPMENPTTRSGNLTLLNIREEDEGKYTCIVCDPRSSSEGRAEAWLFFSDPPQIDISIRDQESTSQNPSACNPDLTFIEVPENLQRPEGDFVELKCRVSDEDALIVWFKDRQRIDPGVNGNGIIVSQYNELLIPSFDSGHQGHYACVVLDGDTECLRAEASITLNPLGYFSIIPEDASIDGDLMDFHFFMCTPKDETWSISWEKDDEPMGNPTTRRGNLVLLDIREEDEGKYTCVVRDPRGRSEGRVDAWLFLSNPLTNEIATTCGTITFWRDTIQPTPSAEVAAPTEADVAESDLFSWSSSGAYRADGSGRVVGGNRAQKGSAPFMVRIMTLRDREWIHRCGATLLDKSWILTAAHCMFEDGFPLLKENMDLFFGEYDTSIREGSEMQRRLAEIIVHEEFNKTTFDNDIALIRIEPPLRRFTSYIRPICLAPSGLSHRLMQNAPLGRVTGWGQFSSRGPLSRFLEEVEVPFVDRQTCRESVADDAIVITDSMFCAGYYSTGKDACGGDIGGPLAVRHDDGRWYQLGIVSWGIGCAARGEYGFYTRVSRFLDWIRSKEATVAYSPNVGTRFNESLNSDVLAFATRSPSELTVAAGSKVDLECVPNRSDASVEWFIGNSPNPVNSLLDGVRILRSGTVLRFDAIEEAFSGVYSCEARVNGEDGEQTIRATFQLDTANQACVDPGLVQNGVRIGNDYSFGAEVTYFCNPDYTLHGSSRRVCTPFGEWSGFQPYCVRRSVWEQIFL